jgi:DNA-binding CsgD family transcriptional regulator
MTLDDRDASAVLRVAVALTANPPPDFDAVLQMLTSIIVSASASFNDMAFATRDYRYAIIPADDAALAERLKPQYDLYAHQHPLINAGLADPGLGAIRFQDVAGGDGVTATELFRNFYVPFNIRYQLTIRLPSPPDVLVGYALNRPEAAGDFSDRDVAVLNALSGHLAMHHRLSLETDRARLVSAEMGLSAWVVASVRSDGIVQASSSDTLPADSPIPAEIAHLIESHDTRSLDDSRHEVILSGARWECVIRPVPLGPTVVLLRRSSDETASVTRLRAAGLTPRQCAVLLELAHTGGANSDIAAQLGMSQGTVKKHLENIFRTLSVASRAAAILKARDLTR